MSDAAEVSRLLLKHRHGILAYIYSVVRDYHAVEDIFQEVSLVVVQKASEFEEGTHFPAWARSVTHHKIREYLRKKRGVVLDESLFTGLESEFRKVEAGGDLDLRKEALRQCLSSLSERARQMLVLRYAEGLSAAGIAERTDQSRAGVNSLLQRIRETLRDCVQRRLGADAT